MQVTHDKKLLIAIGRSRKAVQWQNREMLWSEFLDKLANTTRTRETVNDYAAMTKAERDNVKDVGGFVGGYLKNGRRSSASVVNRCIICLDADNADAGLLDDLDIKFINAYALYSTHSHTPEKMRLRLIVPLSRTVTPDEYAAISRRIADDLTLSASTPRPLNPRGSCTGRVHRRTGSLSSGTRISRFSTPTRCSPPTPTGRTPPSGRPLSRWRRRCAARFPSRKTR